MPVKRNRLLIIQTIPVPPKVIGTDHTAEEETFCVGMWVESRNWRSNIGYGSAECYCIIRIFSKYGWNPDKPTQNTPIDDPFAHDPQDLVYLCKGGGYFIGSSGWKASVLDLDHTMELVHTNGPFRGIEVDKDQPVSRDYFRSIVILKDNSIHSVGNVYPESKSVPRAGIDVGNKSLKGMSELYLLEPKTPDVDTLPHGTPDVDTLPQKSRSKRPRSSQPEEEDRTLDVDRLTKRSRSPSSSSTIFTTRRGI